MYVTDIDKNKVLRCAFFEKVYFKKISVNLDQNVVT